MDVSGMVQSAIPLLTQFALKVVGAIALWLVGRWLIRFAVKMLVRTLKYPFDQTVAGYIGTATSVLLNIALIVAILGFFGIETTSFAALMAGVGIAIGAAWSGLLAHLAAGIFLLILRPFKVGGLHLRGRDRGHGGGDRLFRDLGSTRSTTSRRHQQQRVFAETIQNFSAIPIAVSTWSPSSTTTRITLTAIRLLKARVRQIPNVKAEPQPDVEILTVQSAGPDAGGATLLQQRAVLAGVLRHQPGDPGDPGRGRVPRRRAAHRGADGQRRRGDVADDRRRDPVALRAADP